MRPEKFSREVDNGIARWLNNEGNKTLIKLLPRMERQWGKWADQEGDYRSGLDTYGYKDKESIRDSMWYISDRWRCAFRLKWLIDGLKDNYI